MQIGEVLYPQLPPDFRMPRQRASTGTGNVNQNAIERLFQRQWSCPIGDARLYVSNARKFEAFLHGANPMLVEVRSRDMPIRSHRPREDQRLASRRRTKIEDAMPGWSLNQVRHRLRSFILSHDRAVAHCFARGWVASLKRPRLTQQPPRLDSAASLLKGSHRLLAALRVKQVPGQRRDSVVGFEQTGRTLFTK